MKTADMSALRREKLYGKTLCMGALHKNTVRQGGYKLLVLALCVVLIAGCAQSLEKGSRDVVQKFFDALKMGDTEGAFSCYTPAVQQQLQAANEFGGILGEMLFGVDASGLMYGLMGYASASEYQNYEFKATDVTAEDDEHGVVTVEIYIDGELDSTTKINTVKYQGKWYVAD